MATGSGRVYVNSVNDTAAVFSESYTESDKTVVFTGASIGLLVLVAFSVVMLCFVSYALVTKRFHSRVIPFRSSSYASIPPVNTPISGLNTSDGTTCIAPNAEKKRGVGNGLAYDGDVNAKLIETDANIRLYQIFHYNGDLLSSKSEALTDFVCGENERLL